jgi:hypothetical protein
VGSGGQGGGGMGMGGMGGAWGIPARSKAALGSGYYYAPDGRSVPVRGLTRAYNDRDHFARGAIVLGQTTSGAVNSAPGAANFMYDFAVSVESDKRWFGGFGADGAIDTLAGQPIEVHTLSTDECIISRGESDLATLSKLIDLMDADEPATTQPVSTTQPAAERMPDLRLFFCERTAIAVARLVAAGQIEQARKLAEELAKAFEQFEIGVKMHDVLADESLAPVERDQRIAALGEDAARLIDDAVRGTVRRTKLRQRLDGTLYLLATDEQADPASLGIESTDTGLRVTVLADRSDPATLAALRQAGLTIDSTVESLKLAVGTAPRDKLADLALLDHVRRIDPTR